MKIKNCIYLFAFALLFTSCIPNKDLVYLQKTDKKATDNEVKEVVAKPYRVQTNDILTITIKALDQKLVEMFNTSTAQNQSQNQITPQNLYFTGYSVDDHGNIRIPVLGNLNVLGYTLEEIRATIEKKLLDEYFNSEARLYVTVKLAGLRYTINGEITNPGTNVLYQDKATIMEAIANSGDITMTGDRKKVQIIRKYPHGYETYTVDLTKDTAIDSPYFYLQPNDYIYIKPLKQKSWGTGTTGVQTISTIITALSLVTTTILLTRNL
ncbi:MAG: sugar transporter [Flavobacterium sp.]|uniref:polysaccharide biosynthesis/export family protein n=1 Tax=unclassified Flavobacterium TaxID=196869 RepID=UPI000C60C04F|nr:MULTISPECIES: polysaccharide biosynthesis/export family protein [unclassified Flavobacterium]MBF02145.1 sugar transporter [Flavobacterium sp.]MCO6164235.1 polysaccharide biosynthesis/export family protein [Flavobacterium sp. NRK F7]|tara:strand:- start:102 stop:902 length:801 start_codon:yes stop_codon:yes gene_type:complete